MADFECPKCRAGWISDGRCPSCGWTILRPRPPHMRSDVALPVTPVTGTCWGALPIAAGLANVVLPIACEATESDAVIVITMGTMAAELGLLAIFGALGPGRHFIRLPVTLGVAVALLLSLVLGLAAAGQGRFLHNTSEWAGFFLILPGLLLAIQSPLWLFRALTGGRIKPARDRDPAGEPGKAQFGILQLMMAMTLIAVCLAFARGALVLWNAPAGDLADAWLSIGIVCGILAVVSLGVTVPCTMAMLVAREPAIWIVAIVFYILIVSVALLSLIGILTGGMLSVEEFGLLVLFEFSTFAAILAGLGVIRACGYRVRGGPGDRRVDRPSGPH